MKKAKKQYSEIIEKIKKDKIRPIPKWQCSLVNVSFWLAVVAAVFFGSVFLSFLLMNILELPMDIFRELYVGRYIRILFQVIPYLWLILVLVSMILGLVAFQKTKHGYRYKFVVIASVAMTLVLMLGFFFKQNQIGRPMKELAESKMPVHLRGAPFNKAQSEELVEEGLLAGEIVQIDDIEIKIKNPLREEWKIITDDRTNIKDKEGLNIGDRIFIIGEKISDFIFHAFSIKEVCEFPGREGDFDRPDFSASPPGVELMGEPLHHQ